jgi:CRP/FNR family transcriptional regulator
MPATAEELMRSIPVWRRLSKEDQAQLATVSGVATFARGDHLFSEGDPSEAFITIATGRVKIVKSTPAGKDVILEVFGAGDPLGAAAAFEGRPFPASAVALEPTTCLAIPRREFFSLLERRPTLVRGLLLGLTLRMVELTNRIVELSGGKLEPRFARMFLKMAEESGHPCPDGVLIPGALSRQDLADLAGTTIETCIRIMSRWGKEGLVRTDREGFVILDRTALETLAGLP